MSRSELTAKALSAKKVDQTEIVDHFRDIVSMIDGEILEAHAVGSTFLRTNISKTFRVPQMDPEDAKREIYFLLLTDYMRRGFRVHLKEGKDMSRFSVVWFTDNDLERIKKQKQLIEYCLKDFNERKGDDVDNIVSILKRSKQISRQPVSDHDSDSDTREPINRTKQTKHKKKKHSSSSSSSSSSSDSDSGEESLYSSKTSRKGKVNFAPSNVVNGSDYDSD